jgi:hypothetical protein
MSSALESCSSSWRVTVAAPDLMRAVSGPPLSMG